MRPSGSAAILVLSALMTLGSCSTASLVLCPGGGTRDPPIDLRALMVGLSAFPPGWVLQYGPARPPPGKHIRDEYEGGYIQFKESDSGALAMHTVLNYRNDCQAGFYDLSQEFPSADWVLTPWSPPEGWTFDSRVADRFEFGCATLRGLGPFKQCKAVAQYDEFISLFQVHVSSESMTYAELESILVAIDESVASQLGKGEE